MKGRRTLASAGLAEQFHERHLDLRVARHTRPPLGTEGAHQVVQDPHRDVEQGALDGQRIHSMSTKEVARKLGILPQTPIAPEGITVADLVSRGRHPHQRPRLRGRGGDAHPAAVA